MLPHNILIINHIYKIPTLIGTFFWYTFGLINFGTSGMGIANVSVRVSTISSVLNHAEGGVTKSTIALNMLRRSALHWKRGPVA